MLAQNVTATFEHVGFVDNLVEGPSHAKGGAVLATSCNLTFHSCLFLDNRVQATSRPNGTAPRSGRTGLRSTRQPPP